MRRLREIFLFVLASLLLSFAIFGDGMMGKSINAPIDIAPALWERFKFVDPQSDAIPENHFVSDQLSYDLPLQWCIYHAYREYGEWVIPWWNPYTHGGRPLLADSHINGTDVLRVLLYLAIPDFVLAYNWTMIVHHLVLGLGLFVLLRHLGAGMMTALTLGLAGQFAGAFILFIGHPWITGSFCWYPWLWLAWALAVRDGNRGAALVSPVLIALVFAAGNLQSHGYLPLFGIGFIAGYGWRNAAMLRRALWVVTLSGVAGALLAAPVLGPTVELFLRNDRPIHPPAWRIDGLLTLAGLWPWSLGTFRTLSHESINFCYYLGPLIFILAALGLKGLPEETAAQASARRASIAMLVVVFLVYCTPVYLFFYIRLAGLGVMPLVVLALNGVRRLQSWSRPAEQKFGRVLAIWCVLLVAGTLTAIHVLYPRLRPKFEAMMTARAVNDGWQGRSEALRRFQVDNYPSEIGFTNPEVAAALATLVLAAAAALSGHLRRALPMLLVVNLVSPALFARRFVPRQPVEHWDRFREGSAEQQAVRREVGGGRIEDENRLFPFETSQMFEVHIVRGYAAMYPRAQIRYRDADPGKVADYNFVADQTGAPGRLVRIDPERLARFRWVGEDRRPLKIGPEGWNHVVVSFPAGGAGQLLRTDTYYPGWTASTDDGQVCAIRQEGIMSVIEVPAKAKRITLRYWPAHWGAYLAAVGVGVVLSLGLAWRGRGKSAA